MIGMADGEFRRLTYFSRLAVSLFRVRILSVSLSSRIDLQNIVLDSLVDELLRLRG